MHNAASQEGKYWLLIVKSVVFYKGVVSLTVTSPDHLLFALDLQRTETEMHTCLLVFPHLGVVSHDCTNVFIIYHPNNV